MNHTHPRRRPSRLWLACPLALVTLLLPACDTINTVERQDPVGHANIVPDRRVITNPELEGVARVLAVRESTVSGDMLKIQVDLANWHSHTRRIVYKFEWFDPQGMLVSTPLSTWQPCTLQGKETVTVTGVAPTPAAKDFRLKLQLSARD
jgi:uncharacterized protein YcfL